LNRKCASCAGPDSEVGRELLGGGARPPASQVVAFIDAHRHDVVEPICRVLQVAPRVVRVFFVRRTPSIPATRMNRHFDGVRTRAGLAGVRLHDFRHTVVSLLLELGTPPHVVQAIARHADLDVTLGIYAPTNLDAMREALDKIEWEI